MRFRPKIDEHDFNFKTKHVRNFIESGSKVKIFVMFRGREMAHTEYGRKVLDRVLDVLKDIANVEVAPKLDGRRMTMVISPKPDIHKKKKQDSDTKKSDQNKSNNITNDKKEDQPVVKTETD